MAEKRLPLPVPEGEIEERFITAPGPGGQNVNKVATAVQLRFDIGRSSLADDVKVRLKRLGGHRVSHEGSLVIEAHEHRTQKQNREAARTRLAELVRRASVRPKPRRPTKPSPVARERRLVTKHKRSAVKRRRGVRVPDDED
jgi:ribosome-associated protein